MPLILVTQPVNQPVTLAEAKDQCRVDENDWDDELNSYIATAAQHYDGRDGMLGRCLITQTWKLTQDFFTTEISLPLAPCQSIASITYVDIDGATQVLDPSEYRVTGIGSAEGAIITPAHNKSWPSIRPCLEAVIVIFVAGYGDDPEHIPEPIRTSIKLRIGHYFENHESSVIGTIAAELPFGEDNLIRNYKRWCF